MDGGEHVVSGCLHMHTQYSDGSGTVSDLVKAAVEADLDFIVITDHMDLRAREGQGLHGDLQVVVGYEHHDAHSHNHYLVLDTESVLADDLSAEALPKEVRRLGGVGIIAHPEERRRHMDNLPPYPWTAWAATEFDGIELWNQMSEWTEHLTRFNRFWRVWSPRKALRGPSERLLYVWDVLNTRRPIAGIAGVDAHAHPYRLGPLTIPIFPYKVHFRTLQTHVVLEDAPPADPARFRWALFEAIRSCRVFFSSERWGATTGFSLSVEGNGARGSIGGEIRFARSAILRARWPSPATWELVCNGFPLRRGEGVRLELPLERAGAYRLALYRGGRGWLFTNHFRLVDA
jgi:hypothetical protein